MKTLTMEQIKAACDAEGLVALTELAPLAGVPLHGLVRQLRPKPRNSTAKVTPEAAWRLLQAIGATTATGVTVAADDLSSRPSAGLCTR